MPAVVTVHAADLGHAVELADLAGQVKTRGSGSEDLVALGGEAGVGAASLVNGAPLHLRLGALAPPLLLLIVGGAAAEKDSLQTFNSGDFPANSWFLAFKNLPLGDLSTLSATNSLTHLWSVGSVIVETSLVVVVVDFVAAVVVVEVYLAVIVVETNRIDIVVVVEVKDGRGVWGG